MAVGQLERRVLVIGLVRASGAALIVALLYFLLPLERISNVSLFIVLPLALATFTAFLVVQVVAVARSGTPRLRAIEALGSTVPLFLVIFAATYFVQGISQPSGFSESLSRLDALYFSLTIFTTVGFGDITAVAAAPRATVTLQMIADLVVIGIGLRVIVGAVQHARQQDETTDPTSA